MLSSLLTFVVFILILGVLIFVHELGHFSVAKWVGMRVDDFALGFPPKIYSKKKGETTYSINALPLGGYVKIHGETGELDKEKEPDPRSFGQKSVWARIAVLFAGVGMNFLFAFVVLTVAFSVGFVSVGQDLEGVSGAVIKRAEVVIGQVMADSAAQKAGIESGDVVKKVSSGGSEKEINTTDALISYTKEIQQSGGTDLIIEIDRNGEKIEKKVVIKNDGNPPLGAEIQPINIVRVPVYMAPVVAAKEIGAITKMTLAALKDFGSKLFVKGQLDNNVSGPIGVYQATGVATKQGGVSITFLMVMLSVNLAILNLMPIPALDGGKLVFLATEAICRKRVVKEEVEQILTLIGFGLLILLMVVITVRDFYKL